MILPMLDLSQDFPAHTHTHTHTIVIDSLGLLLTSILGDPGHLYHDIGVNDLSSLGSTLGLGEVLSADHLHSEHFGVHSGNDGMLVVVVIARDFWEGGGRREEGGGRREEGGGRREEGGGRREEGGGRREEGGGRREEGGGFVTL